MRQCPRDYITDLMTQVDRISDADMEAWVKKEKPNPWQEELHAAEQRSLPPIPDDQLPLLEDIVRRIDQVLRKLRYKNASLLTTEREMFT
jgi:hypothetical protein